MPTYRVPRFRELLPATPCTADMRTEMVAIANRRGVSLAEIQRSAFSLFLNSDFSNAIDVNSNANEPDQSKEAIVNE